MSRSDSQRRSDRTWESQNKGFHVGDAPLGVMLNFDTRIKNSDAAQPRVTNVKTPIIMERDGQRQQNFDRICLWNLVQHVVTKNNEL